MNNRIGCLLFLTLFCSAVVAELAVETPTTAPLPEASPHWMWVSDLVFNAAEGGKAFLIDGDSGQMLGMLSTGFFFASALHDSDYQTIYSPEIYMSRGTRGKRTDIIAVYNPKTLEPIDEIIIPPKRLTSVPVVGHAAISEDDRFLVVYNFTPAQSVSVVDAKNRVFIREVETPGCAEVFAAGPRAFNMICGDGTMLTLRLDDTGDVTSVRSKKFFDPQVDVIDDKMAPYGTSWAFFTLSGMVQMVSMEGGIPVFAEPWSLFSSHDLADEWKLGGYQYATICESTAELYVLVHQGGQYTHKQPGVDVWVYDLKTNVRKRKISLSRAATSIYVTQDEQTLMFTADAEHSGVQVYDAETGKHLHDVEDLAANPMLFWPVRL